MRRKCYFLGMVSLFLISLSTCFKAQTLPEHIDYAKLPYKKLSEYGFFQGELSDLMAVNSIVKYEPAASLFTDYAFKARFAYVPKGKKAKLNAANQKAAFDFPNGSILIKNFYYPADFSKPEAEKRIIETRLLVKIDDVWQAYPYQWDTENTEATYKVTGGTVKVDWKSESGEKHAIDYVMPNKNQCKSCHTADKNFMPIGLKLSQLNHEIDFDGKKQNQIEKWIDLGILDSKIDLKAIENMVGINDVKASLDLRARSYLDINCGHCHSPDSPAASSGLRLNFEEKDFYHLGLKKSPVAAGMGAGNLKYDIFAGHADKSIMIYRLNSTHPGVMMPEIGRVSVHKEGVKLISDWINQLQ
jgi:uncharacterized repeat protein (TIGR03806 family)